MRDRKAPETSDGAHVASEQRQRQPSKWQSQQGPDHVETVFERTVESGHMRLSRSWPGLLATGMVGGIDVSIGVFALLLVEAETHNVLLSALAFGIGFIALTLARSELFRRTSSSP